jgi:flagellar protein FliL
MATGAAEKKAEGGGFLPGLVVASIVAAGAGAFFGIQLAERIPKMAQTESKSEQTPAKTRGEEDIKVIPLPPILTNLANPSSAWIRIEASIVYEGKDEEESKTLVPKISEDMVTYLRTVSLAQIEGPSGFQHLREDLNDRAQTRSEGKVHEVIIHSFVLE